MATPPKPAPTRLQQQPARFDDIAKGLISLDATHLANIGKYVDTLAQMTDRVLREVDDAVKPLHLGTSGANPFADTRAAGAGNVVQLLRTNTESVQKNVHDSVADLQRCLKDTAAAMDRIAKAVHDKTLDNEKRLRQLIDSAFNPQPPRAGTHAPALRPAPGTPGPRRA